MSSVLATATASPTHLSTTSAAIIRRKRVSRDTAGPISTPRTFAERTRNRDVSSGSKAQHHSEARTVAVFARLDRRSSRTTAPGLRRRSSHDDLKAVAHYSDKPLPPLPLQPQKKQPLNRSPGRPREPARLDKPLRRLPERLPFLQTLSPFKLGPGKFREGPERRDVRSIEAPPIALPNYVAELFPASPQRVERKRDRFAKLLCRKDSVQEMTAASEEALDGLYADELFRQRK